MIESPIEEWVCSRAEEAGWLVRKLQWVGRRSAPDRFFAKEGRVVLIEFKRHGAKAKAGQAKEIARLRDAGVEVYQADSPMSALRYLGIAYAEV